MFKIGYRKFILTLLISYCLFGQYTDALRCYQCKQGIYRFCSSSEVAQVTCPTSFKQPSDGSTATTSTCGYAVVPTQTSAAYLSATSADNYVTTWRGCVSSSSSASTISGAFGINMLLSTAGTAPVLAVYTTCTSASDLCNKPRQCYRCTGGWTELCSITDIVLDECFDLSMTYCATVLGTSSSYSCTDSKCYWKGCLTSSSVTTLTATSGLTPANLETAATTTTSHNAGIAKTGTLASTFSATTSISYCSTDGCNAGTKTYSSLSYTLAVALALICFNFKN